MRKECFDRELVYLCFNNPSGFEIRLSLIGGCRGCREQGSIHTSNEKDSSSVVSGAKGVERLKPIARDT